MKVTLRIVVPRSYHFDFTFQNTDILPILVVIYCEISSQFIFTGFFTGSFSIFSANFVHRLFHMFIHRF